MLFKGASKEVCSTLMGQSQWLTHVVVFNWSSLYIVQYFMDEGNNLYTILDLVDAGKGPHIRCGWICSNKTRKISKSFLSAPVPRAQWYPYSYYKTWLNTPRICSASLRFNSTSLLFTLQYMVELHLEYPVNPSVSFHRTLWTWILCRKSHLHHPLHLNQYLG